MLMRYDDTGGGPPVLLLHSGVCDRRMWDAQADALSPSFRVVRPDLRGFGETPMPGEDFAFDADVATLLDHLGIEKVALVGSSFGGRVALEVAATRPDRVSALLLLCPAFRGLAATAAADAFDEREDALIEAGDIDAAVELNVATWLGPEASAETKERVRVMQRQAFDVQLAAEKADPPPNPARVDPNPADVTAPTLVVSGDLDMDHFQAIAAHLAETIPDARLLRLAWAKHLPSLERPAEVTEIITEFLTANA